MLVSSASAEPESRKAPRAAPTASAGSRASAGRTASTRPASTSRTRSRSTRTCCCARLVGYNHVGGPAGNDRRARTSRRRCPKPTNGGKTYTFTLKNGVRFGPPVNREITLEGRQVRDRAAGATRRTAAQYGVLLHRDQGLRRVRQGQDEVDLRHQDAEREDDRLRPHRSRPVTSRCASAMPAADPMPQEVAKCFEGKPGAYGRYVIASGPYMIEGSDDLDISSCEALKPISGYDGKTTLTSSATRTTTRGRTAGRPGRTTRTASSSPSTRTSTTSTTRSRAGELEDEYATASPKVFREYSTNASKRKYLHSNSADGTYYITMNLTQPPFDDVHVRRAMNWVMDRDGAAQGVGRPGRRRRRRAHHPEHDARREAERTSTPFKTPGDRGQRREGEGRDEASRSTRNYERRLHGEGVQERAAHHRRPGRRTR